ncbi:NAD(P)-binding protein [Hyaloscypha bicolor E]|uniref:NAD(P)-binding protein n=1 Tax=Hyaloscypha bicolor E TaxID=1095630 RepID=A0A2J6SF64_9HELO|nr:NAD(P)-binding protein [Hyaloscypha bicolor E]PMD49415.1 NAD(P)-binding protein [Hyaloscypha bicolor E]
MPIFVITGANRGLGLEFFRQLSTDSSNTILAATRSLSGDLGSLESLKSNGATLHIIECDTGSQDSIAAFSKQVTSILGGPEKKIDFLLNNAGINATHWQTSLTLTAESLSNHMNVNVMGPAKTVQVLESHLQKGSVVMNMTSGLGSLAYIRTKDLAESAAYSISKAALNMLTIHQANNLKGQGVVVVCVDPGWVKTDMGGTGAVLEKEESIGGMLKCLRGLKSTDSGRFFVYDGSEKGW